VQRVAVLEVQANLGTEFRVVDAGQQLVGLGEVWCRWSNYDSGLRVAAAGLRVAAAGLRVAVEVVRFAVGFAAVVLVVVIV
jgi:hypothetical protein